MYLRVSLGPKLSLKTEQAQVRDQSATCVSFDFAGGMIEVAACADRNDTSVELISRDRDRDHQLRQFASMIATTG